MKKWFVFSIILLCIVLHVSQIVIYSTNIPYWDDYDAILNFLNEFKSNSNLVARFDLLFSQHNEHKILLDRLVVLADYYLFGEVNFRHIIYVGNFFVVLLLIFTLKITIPIVQRNQEPWKWFLLLPIPFLLLNMQSYDNFLWGMASIQNLGVIFFSFLCFYALFYKPLDRFRFSLAVLSSAVATYTSGNGFLCLVIGLFVILITKKKPVYIILWVLSSGLLLYSYLHNYHPAPGHPDPVNTLFNETGALLLYFFTLLSSGWEVFGYNNIVSLLIGSGFLMALVLLIRERIIVNQPLLFSILLFLILTCCLISLSRAGFGLAQALDMRYRIYPLLLFMFAYLAFLGVQQNRIFTWKQSGIILVFITLTFANYLVASAKYQRPITEAKNKLIHGLASYYENNKYFYLGYPRESEAREIIARSSYLGTYTRKLSYVDIASHKVDFRFQPTNDIDFGFGLENRDDYLFVDNGWAYIEEMDAEDTDRFVVLKSDSIELVYDSYWHIRPDVTAAKKVGNLDRSGFSCIILKEHIPDGIYKVGILIRKDKKLWQPDYQAFEFTDMIVAKNRNGVYVGTDLAGWVPLMSETNHYIDELKINEDSISIRGWALIHGISSEEIRTTITFISEIGKEIQFIPNVEFRPDVAKALHGDYSSAGFNYRISKNKFENSTYQIVITLTHLGQEKIIEIGEKLVIRK